MSGNNGENGYLVEPKNVEALVKIIIKVIEDRGDLVELGNASRKTAVEKYDANIVNQQIENILDIKEIVV